MSELARTEGRVRANRGRRRACPAAPRTRAPATRRAAHPLPTLGGEGGFHPPPTAILPLPPRRICAESVPIRARRDVSGERRRALDVGRSRTEAARLRLPPGKAGKVPPLPASEELRRLVRRGRRLEQPPRAARVLADVEASLLGVLDDPLRELEGLRDER